MQLCLNMIVRDEAGVIADTLANVLEHVDIATWVIHDTGSCDDTPAIVRRFFDARGIRGRLVHRAWESFGANRQYALEDAQGLTDYVLFFDADNLFEGRVPALPSGADALMLNMRRNNVTYPAKLIVRNDGSFRWRGVVHEALYFQGAKAPRVEYVAGDYWVNSRSAGARSRDAVTYYRDARILSDEIAALKEHDRDLLPRYTFYCANSWRDAHLPREAAAWYRKRIELGGWADEVYCSWLGLGIELDKIGDQDGAVLAFLSGHEVCPERAECLYHLARLLRTKGQVQSALIFATEGVQRPMPGGDRLFIWGDVYRYWMDFELLMCLKDLNRLDEGADALRRLCAAGAPAHLFAILGVSAAD